MCKLTFQENCKHCWQAVHSFYVMGDEWIIPQGDAEF
jgi:hypothetical protein